MTRKERESYREKTPIAVLGLTNFGGLAILEMEESSENGDTYLIAAYDWGEGIKNIGRHKVYFTAKGQYFRKTGRRFYLDQFIRVWQVIH